MKTCMLFGARKAENYRVTMNGLGIPSQLRSHVGECPHKGHSLISDNSRHWRHLERSNSDELARIVTLCVHFLTCCLDHIYFCITINCELIQSL
jgi:hypothetical protein